jgi:hypothetical protein
VRRLALFRRREIWFPTLWGWLALLVLGAAFVLFVGRSIHGFLAMTDPVGARVLVVEGWMGPEELDEVIAVFRARGYERIITTGGPMSSWSPAPAPTNYADRAALYLKEHGVPEEALTAVPARARIRDRTYNSAVTVREWAKRSGLRLEALDLISDGPHARRSRALYQLAFGPEVKVGVLATKSYDYDAARWWRSSLGAKDVIEQAIEYAWVKCCFRPG